ncbi:hypothetical protein HanIR_Chr13g0623871 [Helianthus annuus]|nr:hypothetical protein HanIR_Chr13g0623871 [Helianthus annuus]
MGTEFMWIPPRSKRSRIGKLQRRQLRFDNSWVWLATIEGSLRIFQRSLNH